MMNQLADAQAAFGSDEEFSIRDLCDAFDVTPRALRFYESQELIMPRRDGQRRIYTLRDRARL
ncbi:MAG: MerR family DNA-binding transcriptional regulator, partial [Pseudomonadota bacterium]